MQHLDGEAGGYPPFQKKVLCVACLLTIELVYSLKYLTCLLKKRGNRCHVEFIYVNFPCTVSVHKKFISVVV